MNSLPNQMKKMRVRGQIHDESVAGGFRLEMCVTSILQKLVMTRADHNQVGFVFQAFFEDGDQPITGVRESAALIQHPTSIWMLGLESQLQPGSECRFERVRPPLNCRAAQHEDTKLVLRFVDRERFVCKKLQSRGSDLVKVTPLFKQRRDFSKTDVWDHRSETARQFP